MGEVYRARDAQLTRDVAIKVLPASVASDRDQFARFEREATILASLNHPNIAHVYGLERTADISALVMELVDGDDLSRTLDAGPLPVDQVVAIATQIADALAAAHERGIIHRDLKPANIKVRRDGFVKVLDFGLAKATTKSSAADETMTRQDLTGAGIIVGTPAYMSPEQVAGDAVDARTDVWAFGCVLFEMLSGRKAFDGNSGAERMTAVLKSDPDWQLLAAAPKNLQSLVRRCLQKDMTRRIGNLADAKMWLEDATAIASAPVVAERSTNWLAIVASVIAIAAIGAASWMWRPATVAPRQIFRLHVAFDEPYLMTGRPAGANFALSPAGDEVVYHALSADSFQLVRRRLDSLESVPIAGTDLAQSPTYSPDGKRVAFFSRGAIRSVPVTGGTPSLVCEVPGGGYPFMAWTDDGFIWFAARGEALYRVPAAGGTPTQVANPEGAGAFLFLAPVPGGAVTTLLNPPQGSTEHSRVVAITGDGGITALVDDADGFGAAYGAGHLVFHQGGKLVAAPFDATRLDISGERIDLAEGTVNQLAASRDGTLAYLQKDISATNARERFTLNVLTPDGHVERTITHDAPLARQLRISPDGRSFIVVQGALNFGEMWRYSLGSQSQPIRITSGGSTGYAAWRPDGRDIAYQSRAARKTALMNMASDGSVSTGTVLLEGNEVIADDWSPDGATLVYEMTAAQTGTDVMLLNRATGAHTPWLQTPANEAEARISPDGMWVTYVSDQTGRNEVWIRAFSGGAPIRVSADGGHQPAWSRSGKSIYFTNGTRMMAADVSTMPALAASTPRQLFEGGFIPYNSTYRRTFDVTSDDRFLVAYTGAVEANQPLVVLLNALSNRR